MPDKHSRHAAHNAKWLDNHLSRYHAPWYRRLWARLRRQG